MSGLHFSLRRSGKVEVWVGSKRHIDLAVLWYVVAAFGGMRNAKSPRHPSIRACMSREPEYFNTSRVTCSISGRKVKLPSQRGRGCLHADAQLTVASPHQHHQKGKDPGTLLQKLSTYHILPPPLSTKSLRCPVVEGGWRLST